MKNIAAVILAAGEGTRMRSSIPKVLHTICGRSMIDYPLLTLKSIGIQNIVVVVGHRSGLVQENLTGVKCIKQDKLLGTGDAVLKTKNVLLKDNKIDMVLITCGDVPLLKAETLRRLISRHLSTRSGCTLLTSHLKNPTGYGRILRSGNDKIVKIVEEVDASIYEKVTEEINVGVYCFDKDALFDALQEIKPNNRKKEYYLTDTIEILAKSGIVVDSISTDETEEFLGVNTRSDLMQAEEVVRRRVLADIMQKGVSIIDPNNTYIQEGVEIKRDTVIYPIHL